MADSKGISAHGVVVKRNGVSLAELKDLTPPALTHKALETTVLMISMWLVSAERARCRCRSTS